MATLLMRSLVASVVNPLLHLSRIAVKPQAFSTFLLGALRGSTPRAAVPSLLRGYPQPHLLPVQGFKTKGVIKRRCRDCYRVKRRGRWFIYCKTNPRHKQRQM